MSNKVLNIQDLCKSYVVNKRQNNVLKNINYSVEEGEMIAIMGPSGSGKSTLLYTVSGMDNITSGRVDFFGRDIAELKANELSDIRLKEMGFVFQQMHMVTNLSVIDNILLPAYQAKKESRKVINERAHRLLKKLGIEDIADSDVNEVSGGQLQRACICRSLINNPKIIFADEPTGALNRTSSDEVMHEFNMINAEGVTIMMVTHDVKVAAKCSRVIYIVDGNIKGEYNIGKYDNESTLRDRERDLNNKLLELGW